MRHIHYLIALFIITLPDSSNAYELVGSTKLSEHEKTDFLIDTDNKIYAPDYLEWEEYHYVLINGESAGRNQCKYENKIRVASNDLNESQGVMATQLAENLELCETVMKVGVVNILSEEIEHLHDRDWATSAAIHPTSEVTESGAVDVNYGSVSDSTYSTTSERKVVGLYTSYTDGDAPIINVLPFEIEVSAAWVELDYPYNWCDGGQSAYGTIADYPNQYTGWYTEIRKLTGIYGFGYDCTVTPQKFWLGHDQVVHRNDIFFTCSDSVRVQRENHIIRAYSDGSYGADPITYKSGPSERCSDWLTRYTIIVYSAPKNHHKESFLDFIVGSN